MLILQWTLPDLCSSFSPLYVRLTCPNAPCFLLSLCSLILPHRETSSLSSDAWMNTGSKLGWETKSEFALCSLQRWVIRLNPAFSSLLAPSRAAQTHLRVFHFKKVFNWSESVAAVLRRVGAKGRSVQRRCVCGCSLCVGLVCLARVRGADCRLPLYLLPHLTVASIWVNVSPLSAPVYLIN